MFSDNKESEIFKVFNVKLVYLGILLSEYKYIFNKYSLESEGGVIEIEKSFCSYESNVIKKASSFLRITLFNLSMNL